MPQIKYGVSRIVFLIGNIAIKIPNPFYGDRYFVMGMSGNIHECEIYKLALKVRKGIADPYLAKVYFRLPFGLAVIMKRYNNVLSRPLTQSEIKDIPLTEVDPKIENFALENNQIVVLDYGYTNSYYTGKNQELEDFIATFM